VNVIEIERLEGPKFVYYWPAISQELDSIPQFWAPWWTKEAIYGLTMDGTFQCWGAGTETELKVVVFTQVAHYPANTILQIFLAFGTGIDEVTSGLVTVFERFAAESGCTMVEVVGRLGWEPKLRDIGFRRVSYTMAMKFEPDRMRMN
jgi:hypothetical protein